MNKIFLQALAWNSATIFIYKISLLLHQITLYSAINHTLYGAQSFIFAGIYLAISITNFGFDETILPFFSHFITSKKNFHQLLYRFLFRFIILSIATCTIYFLIHYQLEAFLHNKQIDCNKKLSIAIAILFIIESIKKTLSLIIKLFLLNKQAAYAEISSLWLYLALTWGWYTIYHELSITAIFIPLIVTSTLEILYFIHLLHKAYQALPSTSMQDDHVPLVIIAHQQSHNYINQIIKALYSPNSITLIFSLSSGFAQVATIKFFINIITLIYTCISKTFGIATSITLSGLNKKLLSELRLQFYTIHQRYFQFLTIVSSSITITILYAWATNQITSIMALQILLFFIIGFIEQASLVYEQFFICQGSIHSLTSINLVNIAFVLCSYMYLQQSLGNGMLIMLMLIASKVISLIMIRQIAYAKWQI